MIPLYFNKNDNLFYFVNNDIKCNKCHETAKDYIIFLREIGFTFDDMKFFCLKCFDSYKTNPFAKIMFQNVARITTRVPHDATLVINQKMYLQSVRDRDYSLGTTKHSVFDVADIQKEYGGQIVDNTVYAGRDMVLDETVQIGDASIIKKLEKEDKKVLSVDDGLALLDGLAKAKPYKDTDDDTKKLE